MNSSKKGVIRY